VLENFMVRETNVKDICAALAKEGAIEAPWSNSRPKRIKPSDHDLIQRTR